jgi:hypothetical protein
MQFFKPENDFEVREALLQSGRQDLVGNGCDCLIPQNPPKEAIDSRRKRASEGMKGDHYHTVVNPAKGEEAGERVLNKGIDRIGSRRKSGRGMVVAKASSHSLG